MSTERTRDVATSVRQRLLNRTRASGEDFELLLLQHAYERLLYRLSRSIYREHFVPEGAMIFPLWMEQPHRLTRDLDLLGRGDHDVALLESTFREVCTVPVEDDGVLFDPRTVRGTVIKEGQDYEGVRVQLQATIGSARLRIQIDVGFGDVITPAVVEASYPTLLDFPAPVLRTYPRETVVAEKYQAMVALGITNSRMKDFYDLWVLCHRFEFDGSTLAEAIRATFERRQTTLPDGTPDALTPEFARDETKIRQWQAFVRRGRLSDEAVGLDAVVGALHQFLVSPTQALRAQEPFPMTWPVGGVWQRSNPAASS